MFHIHFKKGNRFFTKTEISVFLPDKIIVERETFFTVFFCGKVTIFKIH